ncbi:MAG TPA: hypothetical protein VGN26_09585, partial [Armatimonadota bacterium]
MTRGSAVRASLLLLLLLSLTGNALAVQLKVVGTDGSNALTAKPGDQVQLELRLAGTASDVAAVDGILDLQDRTTGAPQASGVSAGGSDAKAAKVTAGPMFDPKGGILLALGSLYAPGQVK